MILSANNSPDNALFYTHLGHSVRRFTAHGISMLSPTGEQRSWKCYLQAHISNSSELKNKKTSTQLYHHIIKTWCRGWKKSSEVFKHNRCLRLSPAKYNRRIIKFLPSTNSESSKKTAILDSFTTFVLYCNLRLR